MANESDSKPISLRLPVKVVAVFDAAKTKAGNHSLSEIPKAILLQAAKLIEAGNDPLLILEDNLHPKRAVYKPETQVPSKAVSATPPVASVAPLTLSQKEELADSFAKQVLPQLEMKLAEFVDNFEPARTRVIASSEPTELLISEILTRLDSQLKKERNDEAVKLLDEAKVVLGRDVATVDNILQKFALMATELMRHTSTISDADLAAWYDKLMEYVSKTHNSDAIPSADGEDLVKQGKPKEVRLKGSVEPPKDGGTFGLKW